MEIAKVIVSGVRADVKDLKPITSGMVGATVSFTFEDPLWNELTKTVVYKTRHGVRDDPEIGEDGVSKIPPELLLCYGLELKVGVYGINDAGDLVIPTVWASLDFIKAGADPSGDPGTDPSLPPWHKLRQDVDELDERVQTLEEHPAAIQPDWNQNDPTQPDYVQNRTHFAESGKVEILPECQPSYDENEHSFALYAAPAFVVGETYTINWNGVEYDCVCQDASVMQAGVVVLGNAAAIFEDNMGFIGNGEPFVMAGMDGLALFLPLDGTTSLTVSIYQNKEIVHKLDNKFIDAEWMATSNPVEAVVYEGEITLSTAGSDLVESEGAPFTVEEGATYKVEWDGTTYECVGKLISKEGLRLGYIGNGANGYWAPIFGTPENTGEPFCYEWYEQDEAYSGWHSPTYKNKTVAVKVTGTVLEPVKLPEKYLPDGLVKTVNGIEPDENGNVEIEVSGGNVGNNGLIVNAILGEEEENRIYISYMDVSGSDIFDALNNGRNVTIVCDTFTVPITSWHEDNGYYGFMGEKFYMVEQNILGVDQVFISEATNDAYFAFYEFLMTPVE